MRWLRYWRIRIRRRFFRPLRHLDRSAERFICGILYGQPRTIPEKLCAALLKIFSLLFRCLSALRRFLYSQRIFRPHYLGCMVISVGNLTVGGTGKTPVVELLARILVERGRKVAVLSRGYKSRSESAFHRWLRLITHQIEPPPRVVSDGKNILLGSEIAGDEPFMLAKNLPGVVVITDKNRVKAGHFAVEKFGCDTLLLDDGFQYLRLGRQLNLVLVDKSNPFGSGDLLPRGILREPVGQLCRATHVFLTKSDGRPDEKLEGLIQKEAGFPIPLIECRHAPRQLVAVGGGDAMTMGQLTGAPVVIFCGIAVPQGFENFVLEANAQIVCRKFFPDHYRFTEGDIQNIFDRARLLGARMVITTEKDAARLLPQWLYPLPTYYLRIEVELLRGQENFDGLIGRITQK